MSCLLAHSMEISTKLKIIIWKWVKLQIFEQIKMHWKISSNISTKLKNEIPRNRPNMPPIESHSNGHLLEHTSFSFPLTKSW